MIDLYINRLTYLFLPATRQTITMAQTILQIFAIVTHFLAIIFLLTAAGLFTDAYFRYNNELNALGHGNSKICILYLNENFTHPNNSICIFSPIGDVLATISMVVVIILSFVKLFCGQVGWVCTKRIKWLTKYCVYFAEIKFHLWSFFSCCSLLYLLWLLQ